MSVLLQLIANKNEIEVILRSEIRARLKSANSACINGINGKSILYIDNEKIVIKLGNRSITLYGYQHGWPGEAFNDYEWLEVMGKNVLDVGASVGDAAIYFATRGAKKVTALEPYPLPYGYMLNNVKINGFEDIIIPVNTGIGKHRLVRLDPETGFTQGSSIVESERGIAVPVLALDEAIENFGPFDVMKMDCQGCEYDAISESKHINQFRQILIEYHNGRSFLPGLLKENGFNVRSTRLSGKVGYIYAKRTERE